MTINVTSVNDAPSGADKTVTTNEDTGLRLHGGRLRLQRSERQPGQCAAGGEDHHAAGGRDADRQRRRGVRRASSCRVADITGGLLKFTPAANANGNGYASFTFQVQDNGGTANGGVDLDPTPNTMTVNVTPVNDAPAGTTRRSRRPKTRPTRSRRPTSASAIRSDSPANTLLAVKITTLPAAGTLTDQRQSAVTAGQFVSLADITAAS